METPEDDKTDEGQINEMDKTDDDPLSEKEKTDEDPKSEKSEKSEPETPPSSVQKLLSIARRQSEQLERLSILASPRKSIRKSILSATTAFTSEIQPVEEPSADVAKPARESVSQPLKELQFRASISARKASLRKDLSYAGYAKSNFRPQPGGCCIGKLDIDDVIRHSKKPLKEPLLKNVLPRDKQNAVAVFAHLMAYMGDLSSREDERDNILQILSGGIRTFEIRDEIYCQICKQTTDNPNSDSNTKGWQAMALSCGMFAPSSSFLPTLEAHLEQVVNGTVGKGKHAGSVTDPPRMASYCLKRLHKIEQTGQRHMLPTQEELEAVEKMGTISATVYLPDSTNKTMPLDPMITTEEVVVKIVQMLGLSEPKFFCLCEVDTNQEEKTLGYKTYVAEVQSMWAGNCYPEVVDRLRGFRLTGKKAKSRDNRVPNYGDDVLNKIFQRGSIGDNQPKFLFKRNLFLDHDPGVAETTRNRELAVVYSQAVHDVVRGAYPLSEQDLLMLAALQMRAETGSNSPQTVKGLSISKFLPKFFLEEREEERKSAVVNIVSGLPLDPSPATRRFDYLDYLKTRYPLSEASWFFVKQIQNTRLPEEIFIAINGSGVFYVQPDSKEELLHMTYTEICSWAYSYTTFSIVTGNLNYNEDHRLLTREGADIGKAMQLFVNRLF
ncbi:hypothetical protein MPTK2_4g21760 [Marchantia polymorpha subsp. ruderalis]